MCADDRSADTWALGVTMYHVMSLKEPWTDRVDKKKKGMAGYMSLMKAIIGQPLDLQALRVRRPTRRPSLHLRLVRRPGLAHDWTETRSAQQLHTRI